MSQSTLAAAGHSTAVPAPRNFRAAVNDDRSIDVSWDAVDGATYTLKEKTKSPNGVKGAIGITATSSHRTPSGHGTYVVLGRRRPERRRVARLGARDGRPRPRHHPAPRRRAVHGSHAVHGLHAREDPADRRRGGGHWNLGIGPRKEDADSVKAAFGDDGKVDGNGIVTVTERGLINGSRRPRLHAHARGPRR